MVKISQVIKKFVNDTESQLFEMIQHGTSYGANHKKKRQASIGIALPERVCGEDLADLSKWRIVMIAIPKKKVSDYVKAMEKYDPPVHKILDPKKLILPDNLACGTGRDEVTGNPDWKRVTCKQCLAKKKI